MKQARHELLKRVWLGRQEVHRSKEVQARQEGTEQGKQGVEPVELVAGKQGAQLFETSPWP